MAQRDDSPTSMTAAETMMWHIEQDPWLAPSGGALTIFDRPVDVPRFRRLMRTAVAEVPRLHQRVVEPATPLGTPHWEVDAEIDLEWHVRHVGAPGDGTLRELLDWLTPWLQDPYDRSRPLWQYVVIDKLADGRGALATKLHHVVTDGAGAVRLAGAYTALDAEQPDPPEVDLDEVLAAEARSAPHGSNPIRELLRFPLGATRAAADALTHPERLGSMRDQIGDLARSASDTLQSAGSPLWTGRSRHRHLEAFSLDFDTVHAAAAALGGTVNDVFVTGAVEGAARYHEALGSGLAHVHMSFVVSTRNATTGTSNAFTPVPVDVPVGPASLDERFATVREVLHRRRSEVHGGGAMDSVAVLANLLPTSVVTGITRNQATHIDLATSNLPGYLGDTWVAGAKTLHTYAFGPVAGTAINLTAYSTAGQLDLGMQIDPAAVAEPARLRMCLEAAYADLVALGNAGA